MNYEPSGTINYENTGDIIEAIIHTEGRRYAIPGLSFEDVAQEIRLECLKAISQFDSTRIGNSPYKFLQTCVKNRLFNMRRGIYVPNNPPCVRCPLWDKQLKACKIVEVGCVEIRDYKNSMSLKAGLKMPKDLDDYSSVYFENDIDAKILHDDIKSMLPPNLIEDYLKLTSGDGVSVSSRNKKRIREIVRKLLA